MAKFLTGLLSFYMILLWILGGLMHLWTIYIAYEISGLFWGAVTFFFPVISQIFWGINAFGVAGLNSPYIQWLIVLVAMWAAYYIFAIVVSVIESKQQKRFDV